jgi:hypothetical protein
MPRKFRKDRILELADIMEKVPDHTYDQGRWFKPSNNDGLKVSDRTFDKNMPRTAEVCVPEGFCNTPACVLGHAAVSGKFGLSIVKMDGGSDSLFDYDVAYKGNKKSPVYSQSAGAKVFGIPYDHALTMFSGGSTAYPFYNGVAGYDGRLSPKQVAKRLREYAENPKIIEEFL